jgi:hypothetical protein
VDEREGAKMGYDVHITRAKNWMDSESHPISLEEWKRCVALDPEFTLETTAMAEVDDVKLAYENDGLAVWNACSKHDIDGNKAWFDFGEGRVTVKNPTGEIISKMKMIAERLNASVIGDDGEKY